MIEITAAAADSIQKSLAAGKVVRMFLAGIDPSGASYGLGLGDPEEEDMIFESRGIKIHMDPKEAELLSETIIDYIDDGVERGFVIRGRRMSHPPAAHVPMLIPAIMITAVPIMTTAAATIITERMRIRAVAAASHIFIFI